LDEFLCLTLLANVAESETAFKARLTAFWTHMLRHQPSLYEQVYSEASKFDIEDGRLRRQYMIRPEVVGDLTNELTAQEVHFLEVDESELYSKAEAASSPDWFQIDH